MMNPLNFECAAHQLESHFASLRRIQAGSPVDIGEEFHRLRSKAAATRRSTCEGLSAWQVAQVARHTQFLYRLRGSRWLGALACDQPGAQLLVQSMSIPQGAPR